MTSGGTHTIRLAVAAEAPAIATLIESAYRGDESKRGWTTETDLLTGPRTSLAEVARLLADPLNRFVVAHEAGGMTGCALIANENGIGYFGMFAVRPDRQGGGLGRTILAAAENFVRELWRCPAITMTVIDLRRELIAYYERRGYRRTGRQKPFPPDHAHHMLRKDFHLVELRKELA